MTLNNLIKLLLCLFLTGCATVPEETILVPESALVIPPRPQAPSKEKVTQRDIAVYIILLRQWGMQLEVQLQSIKDTLKGKSHE